MTVKRKKNKPSIIESDLGKNPLAGSDFKILVNKKTDNEKLEKSQGEWVPQEITLERDAITKVYTKYENRLVVNGLSSASRSLFLWITYELNHGKDWLWVNKKRFMKEADIASVNTYKKAISELIKKTIICPTVVKDVYWINPRLIFCGSRVEKYSDKVVIYEPKEKEE